MPKSKNATFATCTFRGVTLILGNIYHGDVPWYTPWYIIFQTFSQIFPSRSLSFPKFFVSLNSVFRYFRSKMFKFYLAFSSLIRIFANGSGEKSWSNDALLNDTHLTEGVWKTLFWDSSFIELWKVEIWRFLKYQYCN